MSDLRGTTFPFQFDAVSGRVVTTSDDLHVKDSIRRIILYSVTEYPGLPKFGAGSRDYVFAPQQDLAGLVNKIREQLGVYETRVDQVRVQVSNTSPGSATLKIFYRVKTAKTSEQSVEIVIK